MSERYTEKADQALRLAAEAAQKLGNGYVGTEHLLLGLVREGTGTAAAVLRNAGVKTGSWS